MGFRTNLNILKSIYSYPYYVHASSTPISQLNIFKTVGLTSNVHFNSLLVRSLHSTNISLSSSFRDRDNRNLQNRRGRDRDDDDDDKAKNKSNRKPLRKYVSYFFDKLRLNVKGGTGGTGIPFRNGIGGSGGDVVLIGDDRLTLKEVASKIPSRKVSGKIGESARLFCLLGTTPDPTYVKVPVGVTVITDLGAKLGEINKSGDEVVVAKGGLGGREENGYAAGRGEALNITLDLKIIADVGFVGFPNAGKSTLLKNISNASPKIASYPFTTVRPNIGVAMYPNGRQISLADLPGLIEGAHANVGMGHKFLKHVERTKVLLFVVDVHGFQLGPNYSARSAIDTIILLNKELELYDPNLLEKPAILALNKVDLPDSYPKVQNTEDILMSEELLNETIDKMPRECRPEHLIKFEKIAAISAAKDVNSVVILKNMIRETIDLHSELRRKKMEKLTHEGYGNS